MDSIDPVYEYVNIFRVYFISFEIIENDVHFYTQLLL